MEPGALSAVLGALPELGEESGGRGLCSTRSPTAATRPWKAMSVTHQGVRLKPTQTGVYMGTLQARDTTCRSLLFVPGPAQPRLMPRSTSSTLGDRGHAAPFAGAPVPPSGAWTLGGKSPRPFSTPALPCPGARAVGHMQNLGPRPPSLPSPTCSRQRRDSQADLRGA